MPRLARVVFSFLIFFSIILASSFFNQKQNTFASGNLFDLKDFIWEDNVGAENVTHKISFELPYDSEMLTKSDWIIISMPNFSDLTAPDTFSGSFTGTPIVAVDEDNKLIKITDIMMVPGGRITIDGGTATNPLIDLDTQYAITVTISEDEDGNIIKNIGGTVASTSNYQVTVTASIAPAVASLVLSGSSAPGTFITFMENGTVIGTDTAANITGLFVKQLFGLMPGDHTVALYGVDQDERTTSILSLDLNTPIYQQTTVSDLLLSPTIEIDSIEITTGDDIVVSGSSVPDGNINVFTESPLRTYYATASANGDWSLTIDDTDEYIPGDYRIYSLVHDDGGLQSIFSNSLIFSILPESETDTGEAPACDISEGDLNCDSSVNLIDFSILMYYWGGTAAKADINEDESVDLIDFSILMYYWGS